MLIEHLNILIYDHPIKLVRHLKLYYIWKAFRRLPEDVIEGSIPSNLTLHILSAGYPSCSALPDCPAGPDKPSVPGQEEAPGGDGGSAGPERGAGEKVSGLQEGAGRHLASSGGDQVGGEIWVYELVCLTSSVKCYQGYIMVDWAALSIRVHVKLPVSVQATHLYAVG